MKRNSNTPRVGRNNPLRKMGEYEKCKLVVFHASLSLSEARRLTRVARSKLVESVSTGGQSSEDKFTDRDAARIPTALAKYLNARLTLPRAKKDFMGATSAANRVADNEMSAKLKAMSDF